MALAQSSVGMWLESALAPTYQGTGGRTPCKATFQFIKDSVPHGRRAVGHPSGLLLMHLAKGARERWTLLAKVEHSHRRP